MPVDMEKAKELLNKRKTDRDASRPEGDGTKKDMRWYSLPDSGSAKIRFLPPTPDQPLPGIFVYKHYSMPETEKFNAKGGGSPTCLRTWDMECPICQIVHKHAADKDVKDFTSAGRSFMNVLVLDNPKYDSKLPHIMSASDFNLQWLMEQVINPDIGDITDPTDGANVTFIRKDPKGGRKGSFDRTVARKSSPIGDSDEEIATILSKMYNLQEIWRQPDDEYIMAIKEVAKLLDSQLEERVSSLKGGGGGGADEKVPEVAKAKGKDEAKKDPPAKEEKKKEDKKEAAPAASHVPKGAPTCFGTEHSMTAKKCLACPSEFDCEAAQKRAKKADEGESS